MSRPRRGRTAVKKLLDGQCCVAIVCYKKQLNVIGTPSRGSGRAGTAVLGPAPVLMMPFAAAGGAHPRRV